MKEKLQKALAQGGVSLLLAAGLILPCLFALGLEAHWLTALIPAVLVTLVLAGSRLHKTTAWAVPVALAAGFALVAGAGMMPALRAMLLKISGQGAALPLYGAEMAVMLGVVMGLLCYPLAGARMGVYPVLILCLGVLMALWLTGRQSYLACAAPALCALLMVYARSHHEDVPYRRLIALAAVTVALAMLLTPSQGLVYQPWKDAADKLRQAIYDRFFFTEPRNIFSLASQGYYPKGPNQLGGPAEPSTEKVMQVATPQRVYLRGTLFNEYTGRFWLNTTGGHRYRYEDYQWRSLRAQLLDMEKPQGALGQTGGLMDLKTVRVKMVNTSSSTLFTPQRVRQLAMVTGDMVAYFNNASELFITRDLAAQDEYAVTAPLPVAGDGGMATLLEACARYEDGQYARILADYTTLPGHMEEQVFKLVEDVLTGKTTAYEKALAIQNYLSRYYTYTLEPAPEPENVDFVSYFLLRGKEGYCTYFASAMTVMSRMAGLPARYVEGFLAQPGDNGVAYLTGENAHAWTEIYFPGFGWLTFDATPRQSNRQEQEPPQTPDEPEPTPPPPEEQPQDPPTQPPEQQPEESPRQDPPPPLEEPDAPFPWWLLIALGLAAALGLRFYLTRPMTRAARAKEPEGRVMAWAQAAYDLLKLKGLTPRNQETPMAFISRAVQEGRLPESLTALGDVLTLCRYSPHPALEEDAQAAQAGFEALYRSQPGWMKVRLALLRAFTPTKKRDFTRRG